MAIRLHILYFTADEVKYVAALHGFDVNLGETYTPLG